MKLQALTDTTGIATPYDTIWATADVPTKPPQGIERVMLAEDKLYVVLAVVLIIWFGLILFIFRTDRKLDRLERTLQERLPEANTGLSS
ncbi:CcmD family protein [Rhodothermus marinus]|jgi:hypothetical protein|uniref:CcmD family protein n=1 Tax=Rhodothermus marinus (strain ATCC 43812 / DSM 4252 / R-10) TaxID=518766 RepID=D0MF47_RHOM4|nr:hypothetical protein [Rhodothermus marinus]ACY49303.1 hypothetical protein Rmar_2425 [Rhodothermus marinus DSM 4252]AEN74317.1 hypothetical protein Rhom172_2424 [Rhodothermus marinus SG0.5JP17-172]MBO2490702.1 hypothetical protein [Rhodothermus marinus]BBM70745.1 hypothetical protein RmaAA213_25910 [Rhodothermus marinus]